jgi:GTP cyclohydrolase II
MRFWFKIFDFIMSFHSETCDCIITIRTLMQYIRDHGSVLKVRQCFRGSDFVDAMLELKFASSRLEVVDLCLVQFSQIRKKQNKKNHLEAP